MQEKGPENKKMIQLQSGKKIRLYCAGNPTPKIYFDKFGDKPVNLELQGCFQSCKDVSQGDMPEEKCWRDVP
jgi:hypothetical protein